MQNKKRGKKRKLEQRALEEERVVQQLKKQLEGKVSAESLDWLPRTATAQKYIKNQALSETGDVLSLQAIDKLVKGDKTVQQRTTEIKRAIKDRLILSERSKLGEKWVEYSINATVPGGSTFGLGAEFSPMVHPTGILIKKFVKIPGGEKGALEVTGKVAVGDVIVSINGAKVAAGNIHTAMMTLSMIAQVALFSKMDQKLKRRAVFQFLDFKWTQQLGVICGLRICQLGLANFIFSVKSSTLPPNPMCFRVQANLRLLCK